MKIIMPVKRQLKKEVTLGQLCALCIATNKSIELEYKPYEERVYATMECEVEV